MKARSLYHLLIARLSKLTRALPTDDDSFGVQLKHSLAVDHHGEWFQMSWRWRNKEYEINAPSGMFIFYASGEGKEAAAHAGARGENWRRAEDLLRRMASTCEETLPVDPQPDSLSPLIFAPPPPNAAPIRLIAAISLAAGAIAWALYGPSAGGATLAAAAASTYAYSFQRFTLMSQNVHWAEMAIVAAGCLAAPALEIAPVGAALLAAGLALLMRAEGQKSATALEFAGGVLIGALVYPLGAAGWAAPLAISISIGFLHILTPARITRNTTLTIAGGAFTGALVASIMPASVYATAIASGIEANGLLAPGLAALACFALWWIVGRQDYLSPWLALGVIGVSALANLFFGAARPELSGLVALSGYVACATGRLLFAFTVASRAPTRRSAAH